jgi:membrane protein
VGDGDRPGTGRVRRGIEVGKEKFSGSSADRLWRRLDALDFINRAMMFAATLLVCLFPFLIVVNSLAGRSTARGLTGHLGLDPRASAIVGDLFTSSAATSAAVTGASWVFFILSGIAAASAVQELYQRAFDLSGRGVRDKLRAFAWLAALLGFLFASGWAGPQLRGAAGPVVLGIAGLVAVTGFWWFTMWFLLAGRVPWRRLLSCAIATGAFWLAMEAVFSVTFSRMVVANYKVYGPIGVVFSLMTLLIAIGVVLILGAATGLVWGERGLSFRGALGKLRRPRAQRQRLSRAGRRFGRTCRGSRRGCARSGGSGVTAP